MLDLAEEMSENGMVAEVNGETYGIDNAVLDSQTTTSGKYNFDII